MFDCLKFLGIVGDIYCVNTYSSSQPSSSLSLVIILFIGDLITHDTLFTSNNLQGGGRDFAIILPLIEYP